MTVTSPQTPPPAPEPMVEYYASGGCYALALALSKKYPSLELFGIYDPDQDAITHAFVANSEKGEAYGMDGVLDLWDAPWSYEGELREIQPTDIGASPAMLAEAEQDAAKYMGWMDQAIHKTAAKPPSVNSPAFATWFGNSKVVDDDGNPLRVFHGTRESFEAFSPEKANSEALYGPGYYFTADPEIASGTGNERNKTLDDIGWAAAFNQAGYAWQGMRFTLPPLTKRQLNYAKRIFQTKEYQRNARQDFMTARSYKKGWDLLETSEPGFREWLANDGSKDMRMKLFHAKEDPKILTTSPQTLAVYLSIQNPCDMDAKWNNGYTAAFTKGVEATTLNDAAEREKALVEIKSPDNTSQKVEQVFAYICNALGVKNSGMPELLKKAGFDGIRHTGGKIVGNKEHTVWIAFDPNQVKSAIGNSGAYSRDDMRMVASTESDQPEWVQNLNSTDSGVKVAYTRNVYGEWFVITVNKTPNPSCITLFKDGKAIGRLFANVVTKSGKRFMRIDSIEIPRNVRGMGFGKEMYKALLANTDTDGIASYLPDRTNKKQVPSIYRGLGGSVDSDWAFIPKTARGSASYPPTLPSGEAIASYIAEHSSSYVDEEFMEECFRGTHAVLREIPVAELREGDSDHNIPSKAKEKRYRKLPLSTMPPLVVEDGEIQDGNHRFRVAVAGGAQAVWCYDVIDGDLPKGTEKAASVAHWYHGTSKANAEKILATGQIVPGMDRNSGGEAPQPNAVYITDDADYADMYADADGVVLEVYVAPNAKLLPDEDGLGQLLEEGQLDSNDSYYAEVFDLYWNVIYGGDPDYKGDRKASFREFANDRTKRPLYFNGLKKLAIYLAKHKPEIASEIIHDSGQAAHIGPVKVIGPAKTGAVKPRFVPFDRFMRIHSERVLNLSEDWDMWAESVATENPQFESLTSDEKDEAIRAAATRDTKECYDLLCGQYAQMHFPLIVYRNVHLAGGIKSLDTDNVGESWSYDEHSAEEFLAGNQDNYILKAEVPLGSIDWDETLLLNLDSGLGHEENEIRVRFDAPMKLLYYRPKAQRDWNPMTIPVCASVATT